MVDLAYVFAGFFVGTIVGLTGVGGGSLMTPLLIFFFGVKPYMAVGTDLLFAAFTKLGGTVSFARQRIVPWRVVGLLSAGSIPACLVTLAILRWVGPADPKVQALMTTTLGIALLLTAAAMAATKIAWAMGMASVAAPKKTNKIKKVMVFILGQIEHRALSRHAPPAHPAKP